jgi:plasmid stability protein
MASNLIPDLEEPVLDQLRRRASAHGRSPEAEARAILVQQLQEPPRGAWVAVNALHDRLAASGRSFSDSAELLREDRAR